MTDTKANPHRGYHAMLLDKVEELERENAALREQLINVTSELTVTKANALADKERLERDNATLRAALDQQANYQRELRADRDRLDWVCEHLFTTRSAIDAKLEEKR